MNIKGGNLFEKHVEKLVLVVVGILCLLLLFSRVLVSPNKVKYGNRTLNPSAIDARIKEQAKRLEERLGENPTARDEYSSRTGSFAALLDAQMSDEEAIRPLCPEAAKYLVSKLVELVHPLPAELPWEVADGRQYRIPEIGAVTQVSIEHFRMAAYEPIVAVDSDNRYTEDTSETNDIDFVTVAAMFDVVELRRSFHDCYMGLEVNEVWRDPCFAKPVFMAVELQRQEVLRDGSLSEWFIVPRTRVEARRETFKVIENAGDLGPGGVGVHRMHFEPIHVMMDLVQPETYRIASAEEEWFPPDLHRQFTEYQKQQDKRELREAVEAAREKKELRREEKGRYPGRGGTDYGAGRVGSRADTGGYLRGGRMGERSLGSLGGGGYGTGRGRPLGRSRRPKRLGGTSIEKDVLTEIYDELEKIQLTDKTEIGKMREPLTFWAHDDTVEPGKSYRYRIRLGVLNPVAGTGQVSEDEASQKLKSQVVLWSGYSGVTERLDIPQRLYFFADGVQEAAKQVTVKVSKYVNGYWYSRKFRVEVGEVIGGLVDHEAEREQERERARDAGEEVEEDEGIEYPETIDYSTGAVLVDVGTVSSWLGSKRHSEMLYSFDGVGIDHMSVGFSNWSQDIKLTFTDIESAEKRIRKPYQSFVATGGKQRRRTPVRGGVEGVGEDEGDEDASEEAQYQRMMDAMSGGR